MGQAAQDAASRARERVAIFVHASVPEDEVVFTSGATESNNLALRGMLRWGSQRAPRLVISAIEHSSVRDPARQLAAEGYALTVLGVDGQGFVDPDELTAALRHGTGPCLVSIMLANNEIGTVEPIAEIGRVCRLHGALLHVDATQGGGKVPFDVEAMNVDLASISGHKMYADKGVGALYVRRGVGLCPLALGGGQERGLRPGTLPVRNIVGLAEACALAMTEATEEAARLNALGLRLRETLVRGLGRRVQLNGPPVGPSRLPGNLSLSIDGVDGRVLVPRLDARGIACQTGSACNRGLKPSHVLQAIGWPETDAFKGLRLGLGRWTTQDEVDQAAQALLEETT